MEPDNFVNVKLTRGNIHNYHIRSAIIESIKKALPQFSGEFLDVGCGKMPYKEYILENSSVNRYVGLDIENALEYSNSVKPDYTWDGVKMPFDENSFDCVFATEVLEHCPDPKVVLEEMNRVLKQGGVLFITVPFLWNLHEAPYDEYRYTPFALRRLLSETGFENMNVEAHGGWHASMAQMIGLYSTRVPMGRVKRKLFSILGYLLIKSLLKSSRKEQVQFEEGQMITGLSGTAIKERNE